MRKEKKNHEIEHKLIKNQLEIKLKSEIFQIFINN